MCDGASNSFWQYIYIDHRSHNRTCQNACPSFPTKRLDWFLPAFHDELYDIYRFPKSASMSASLLTIILMNFSLSNKKVLMADFLTVAFALFATQLFCMQLYPIRNDVQVVLATNRWSDAEQNQQLSEVMILVNLDFVWCTISVVVLFKPNHSSRLF